MEREVAEVKVIRLLNVQWREGQRYTLLEQQYLINDV